MITARRTQRDAGWDSHGVPVGIGDTDTDGYYVGWIDEEGIAWESVRERDVAIVCGKWRDAYREAATKFTKPPRHPLWFAIRHCRDWRSVPIVFHEIARRPWWDR